MAAAAAAAPSIETVVMVRHAEKPPGGLGQLDCQGLNRALALPGVLLARFGRPAAIFAPDPAEQKSDSGVKYDYVRPLATIEPTAIRLGMPVRADIGLGHLDALRTALEDPTLHDATVFIAWEHHGAVTLAKALMAAHGGKADAVPDWPSAAYDMIYVVRLRWTGGKATADFATMQEGLDGQPAHCPQ